MDVLPEDLSVEELEEQTRALQLEIAVSDAARADMHDGLRVRHAKTSLLSFNGSAVMGADVSGASQSDKAYNIGWPMSPKKNAAEVV